MSVAAGVEVGAPAWARTGAMGALAWGLPVLATIVATPLVIEAVGTEEFGLFVAVNGIVLALASINLARPVTVALAGERAAVTVPATIAWSFACGLAAAVAVLVIITAGLGNLLVADGLGSTTIALVAVAAVGALVLAIHNGVTGLLPGLHRVGTGAIIVGITGCATSVGYVIAGREIGSATSLLAWLVIVLAVASVAHVTLAHHYGARVFSRHAFRRSEVVAAWPATAPFVLAQVAGSAVSVLERIGLARISGLSALTDLAPPQMVVVAGMGAMLAVVGAMVPTVVRLWEAGDIDGVLRWVHRSRTTFAGGSVLAAIAMVAVGPTVIDRWLRGTVTVTRAELVPFALWLVAYCVMGPGMALAESTGQAWTNVWLVVASLVLMVVVGLPAMELWGAAGVAVGRAVLFPLVLVHAVVVDRGVRRGPDGAVPLPV